MGFLCLVLSCVGVATLVVFALRLVGFLRANFFASIDVRRRYAKAGDWAIVTGATEGIGYAMAMDLARRGLNVCAIARTEARLAEVVAEIERSGVKGMAVAFDFAAAGDKEYRELFARLDALSVALLVNNVGVNYAYPNYLDEADLQDDLRILKVNCEPTLRMTRFVLPRMKAKRAGGIVMLSSFSALTPVPLLCTYAGTKAFNLSFGESLAYEVRPFGIDVLVVTPNLVVSKMTQGKSSCEPRESFMMVGARQMARQTLQQIGAVVTTSGHVNHQIIRGVVSLLPVSLVAEKICAFHRGMKRRAESKRSHN